MNYPSWMFRLTPLMLCTTVLSSTVLGLVFSTSVHAQPPARPAPAIRWRPPAGKAVTTTLSGGRRGHTAMSCTAARATGSAAIATGAPSAVPVTALSLLVPAQNQGLRTRLAQPTFAWSMTVAEETPVMFVLTSPQQSQPIYQTQLTARRSGLYRLTLPDSVSLEPGIQYRWMVAIACHPGELAGAGTVARATTILNQGIYARSFVERVGSTPGGSSEGAARTALATATAQAAQGLWYDAIATLINPKSHSAEEAIALRSLLDQGQVQVPSLELVP